MNTVLTLAIPEGAIPAPDGYCYACGCDPAGNVTSLGFPLHVRHHGDDGCDLALAYPADPVRVVDLAVLGVIQTELGLGFTDLQRQRRMDDCAWLHPDAGRRLLARLGEIVDNYTRAVAS